ncbi:hypothetical protein [Chryseobacterium mucoviscidosis]|uniref:hypothetical protein n=1 Tax=Chryseobacterium mucoviscidosis TaxID=1945581 RepID=UPI0031D5F163
MKKVLFGLALIIASLTFGQKVKLKKDIASVDGKEYVKVTEDPVSRYSYNVSSLNGNDIFYLKYNNYKDPKEVDYKYNRDGSVGYFEVMSADLNTVYFETHLTGCLMGCNITDNFIKMIYGGKVVKDDGTLDLNRLEILSKKVGFEYTKKRDEMGNVQNGTNTVIIQDSRPRNGFNISVGR